jgi:hypothetical protein
VTPVTTGRVRNHRFPTALSGQPGRTPSRPPSATVGGIEIVDSFVSAVGWVKPGEVYPSRILLTNHNAVTSVTSVTIAAPTGTTITAASAPAGSSLSGVPTANLTWSGISIPAGGTQTLILQSTAKTTDQLPTIVWRDLSTTATLTTGAGSTPVTSHGPKVIPPGGAYDTARYGDRPFPVIPVEYQDRAYHQKFKNLGAGQHTVKLVVTKGPAYVDGFIIAG